MNKENRWRCSSQICWWTCPAWSWMCCWTCPAWSLMCPTWSRPFPAWTPWSLNFWTLPGVCQELASQSLNHVCRLEYSWNKSNLHSYKSRIVDNSSDWFGLGVDSNHLFAWRGLSVYRRIARTHQARPKYFRKRSRHPSNSSKHPTNRRFKRSKAD